MPDPLGRACLYPGSSQPAVTAVDVCIIRPGANGVNPRWLMWIINSPQVREQIKQYESGTTRKRISRKHLALIRISVPPIAEQNRIVTALEDHLSRVSLGDQNLRRVRLRSSALRRSLLDTAVSGSLVLRGSSDAKEWLAGVVSARAAFSRKYKTPVLPISIPGYELPKGWAITSLDSVSFSSGYGTSTRCDFGAAGDPVLRIPNIQQGEVVLDNLKNAIDPSINLSPLHVDSGDMLFIRTNGSRELIGRVGVVRKSLQVAYASYLIRFRLVPNGIPADWVRLVVSSPLWRSYLEDQASSSAGQYNLNSRILAQLPIPVPPPDEVSSILSQVGRYEDIQRAFDRDCAHGERRSKLLSQSLLAEAFAGMLVPQDSDEEPASVLLERIRTKQIAQLRPRPKKMTYAAQEETLL
jgi:type I restriction enzyme S subunit